jgi:hypothetical protein
MRSIASETTTVAFDLTPFIGYRSSMTFPLAPCYWDEPSRHTRREPVRSLGMRLANEGDLVEMRWSKARLGVCSRPRHHAPTPCQRVILDQFRPEISS